MTRMRKALVRLALQLALAALAGAGGAAWTLHGQLPGQSLPPPPAASGRAAAERASASVVTVYRASPPAGDGSGAGLTLGIGSGVVVDRDGTIVTTNALAGQPGSLRVGLADGTQRPARVLGLDAASGLALLQVDGPPPQAIETAGSERPRVGDTVLALGNALGFGLTATQGIVGAIRSAHLEGGGSADFIQSDAAVHSGNFGGALVDPSGRLVGINVGTLGGEGGQGFSLAVPADRVAQVVAQLRQGAHEDALRPPAALHEGSIRQIGYRIR